MNNFQKQILTISITVFITSIIVILLIQNGVINLGQNKNTQTTPTPSVNTSITTTIETSITPTAKPDSLKNVDIYFYSQSKNESTQGEEFLMIAKRKTDRTDIATFALEELFNGPTNAEKTLGMTTSFGSNLLANFTGSSNCSGKLFTLTITDNKATVKFCKDVTLSGDMSSYYITSQIEKTLMQFSNIKSVKIVTKIGGCFGDLSGMYDTTCNK